MSRIGKSIDIESSLVIAWGWEWGEVVEGNGVLTANESMGFF